MAAGLYISVVDGIDDAGLAPILALADGAPFADLRPERVPEPAREAAEQVGWLPRVFLGEGPWDGVTDDAMPLPTPLARIGEAVAAGPLTVDAEYVARIMVPFDQPGETPYRLGRPGAIWRFLRRHEGKRALLTIRPDEVASAGSAESAASEATEPATGEPAGTSEATDRTTPESAAGEPRAEPIPAPLVRGVEATTVDGVRPLALVLVTSPRQSAGLSVRERILAILATIGTAGASLATAAGLNNLIR